MLSQQGLHFEPIYLYHLIFVTVRAHSGAFIVIVEVDITFCPLMIRESSFT